MRKLLSAACATALALGCDRPTAPREAPLVKYLDASSFADAKVTEAVTGDGVVDLTTANAGYMTFEISARQHADGTADGTFTSTRNAADGSGTVDFTGTVTCLAFDAVNHRAWIAGTIAENRSTSPASRDGAIFQPGRDIWMRVVDYGEGANDQADPVDDARVYRICRHRDLGRLLRAQAVAKHAGAGRTNVPGVEREHPVPQVIPAVSCGDGRGSTRLSRRHITRATHVRVRIGRRPA
jgi:hypothetical protein